MAVRPGESGDLRSKSRRRPPITALISLLEDEDKQVSSLAMEQLLRLDSDVDGLIAEFQESHSPVLRSRIHQMGSIVRQRRERSVFITDVREARIPLWQGILLINGQYNPQVNLREIQRTVDELSEHLPEQLTTVQLAAFMRDENFTFTGEDQLGSDLYLLEDVMRHRVGSPILLSVIAQHLAQASQWQTSVVLYKGKHCLIDGNNDLVEPANGWRVTRMNCDDKLHPCGDRDIWLTILSQLFLAVMLDGRLHTIHRIGRILAELCDGEFSNLPFPIGS